MNSNNLPTKDNATSSHNKQQIPQSIIEQARVLNINNTNNCLTPIRQQTAAIWVLDASTSLIGQKLGAETGSLVLQYKADGRFVLNMCLTNDLIICCDLAIVDVCHSSNSASIHLRLLCIQQMLHLHSQGHSSFILVTFNLVLAVVVNVAAASLKGLAVQTEVGGGCEGTPGACWGADLGQWC